MPRASSAARLSVSQPPAPDPVDRQPESEPLPIDISTEQPEILEEGTVTIIGRRRLLVGSALGEGAYAKVFSARILCEAAGGVDNEAAIKEMLCGQGPGILPDASLHRASFEVLSMQQLEAYFEKNSSPENGPSAKMHAPHVLDYQFWHLGSSETGNGDGAYLCRIVMTRLPGQALMSWLDEWDASPVPAAIPASQTSARAAAHEVLQYCDSFLRATLAARELLAQVGPTVATFNSNIAYHRDVNARNLLVHVHSAGAGGSDVVCNDRAPNAQLLEFSLVDFGKSTDRVAWHAGGGPGSWEKENPTGDARYWGPASWMRFLNGTERLLREPALAQCYSQRLDFFALAFCALEALGTLHRREYPANACHMQGHSSSWEAGLAVLAQRMKNSWDDYWTVAVESFDRLSDYSALVCRNDPQGARDVWDDLQSFGIPQSLLQRLRSLREDMSRVSEYCLSYRGTDHSATYLEVGYTVEALREMVDENSTMAWPDIALRVCPPRRGRMDAEPEPPFIAPSGRSTPPMPAQTPVREILRGSDGIQTSGSDGFSVAAAAMAAASTTSSSAAMGRAAGYPDDLQILDSCDSTKELLQRPPPLPLDVNDPISEATTTTDRDLEALRILRQVESEVRSLKHWYTEAIEAMRASASVVENGAATKAAQRPR